MTHSLLVKRHGTFEEEETLIYNSITYYLKANTPDLNIIIVHSQNNPKSKRKFVI